NHQIGDPIEPLPAPGVELRGLLVARGERIDIRIVPPEAQREPFLALTAELAEPMRWSVIGRKFVNQPVGLAENVGLGHAGLFPELAPYRRAQVFALVNATLRHLPLQTRQDDFRSVILEPASDQDLSRAIEKGDAHIGAVSFVVDHPAPPRAFPFQLNRYGGSSFLRSTAF